MQSCLSRGMSPRHTAAPTPVLRCADARIKVHDEYFQRIRPTTLGAILEEISREEESVYELGTDDVVSLATSVRSGATSVVHSEVASPSAVVERQSHLLLLDMRAPEEYERWHVRGAVSFPMSQLKHATHNLPQDIYYYRGPRDSDKMVVIYDEDGRTLVEAGNTLVQKGVENLYVVHGGLNQFAPRFPHLLEGHVPDLPPPSTPVQPLSALTTGYSTSNARDGKPPSTAASVKSGRTVDTHLTQSQAGTPSTRRPSGRIWK